LLTLLNIKNIALIDELAIEFGEGLNLLTGETGSGKSIIVDSLGALTGERVSGDIIKKDRASGSIEGLFTSPVPVELEKILAGNGIEIEFASGAELIVRRELSTTGKNRVFINDHLVTQGFLKSIGNLLVDIHGQGEQAALYDVRTHIGMLDEFAGLSALKDRVAHSFNEWKAVRSELQSLASDRSEKLQLLDVLRFQVNEIKAVNPVEFEDEQLEEEKRRLNNVEKLTSLSSGAFALLYDDAGSTAATLEKAQRNVAELIEFESKFGEYAESIESARAVIEDLAFALRDFRSHLEFSPQRLEEIESRLAELVRLKRKYGDSIASILDHLRTAEQRLDGIETAEFREEELGKKLAQKRADYLADARDLHEKRVSAATKLSKSIENDLKAVSLEKARFDVQIQSNEDDTDLFSADGIDRVEFYFSANPGESPKPLAKVASGGEASRLMLILKTAVKVRSANKTAVFDEIDVGIGGRVAESVGRKLKELSAMQQVLCVTHQPQIASLADRHFVVEKEMTGNKTAVHTRELSADEQVEEIARMLAGEQITEQARENARSMLAAAR